MISFTHAQSSQSVAQQDTSIQFFKFQGPPLTLAHLQSTWSEGGIFTTLGAKSFSPGRCLLDCSCHHMSPRQWPCLLVTPGGYSPYCCGLPSLFIWPPVSSLVSCLVPLTHLLLIWSTCSPLTSLLPPALLVHSPSRYWVPLATGVLLSDYTNKTYTNHAKNQTHTLQKIHRTSDP